MSGICGICQLDDRPADPDVLSRMMQAMDYWGPHGSGTWVKGPVALGHLHLRNTPESAHENLPSEDSGRGLVLTSSARLDNRDELRSGFGLSGEEARRTPDSHLLMLAWERWGKEAPQHLFGDWSFALWDRQRRELFLARDHHGLTMLYTYQAPQTLYFASSLKALLAVPGVTRVPNDLQVAKVLVAWAGHGRETCYRGIMRLPPAHTLSVRDGQVSLRPYWDPASIPLREGPPREAWVDEFVVLFDRAVACRLRGGPVGIALSGGLDSGAVAALAAARLHEQGRSLEAFSSVPAYDTSTVVPPSRAGDERPWIEATARHIGCASPHLVDAQDLSPLAGIEEKLRMHDQPTHAANNAYWLTALMRRARAEGMETLLTGQYGNLSISWSGEGLLLELARHGQLGRLWKELHAWSRHHHGSVFSGFKRFLLGPLLPAGLHRLATGTPMRGEAWSAYSALNPEMARRVNLAERMAEDGHDPALRRGRGDRGERLWLLAPHRSVVAPLYHETGAWFGLDIRDPTIDIRLLEFCLSLPNEAYFSQGQDRALLRRAMEGRLPEKVLWNRRKGQQAADIIFRLRREKDRVEDVLGRLEASSTAGAYLDLAKMKRVWRNCLGQPDWRTTHAASSILLRGIGVGLFLIGTGD